MIIVRASHGRKSYPSRSGAQICRQSINPAVEYYYPIVRDTLTLKNLDISQCYFIGDKYGSVMQGAIYAEGPGIHVDHCIFYGAKNAVLVFENISDFSITHTIIYVPSAWRPMAWV